MWELRGTFPGLWYSPSNSCSHYFFRTHTHILSHQTHTKQNRFRGSFSGANLKSSTFGRKYFWSKIKKNSLQAYISQKYKQWLKIFGFRQKLTVKQPFFRKRMVKYWFFGSIPHFPYFLHYCLAKTAAFISFLRFALWCQENGVHQNVPHFSQKSNYLLMKPIFRQWGVRCPVRQEYLTR